MAKRKPGPLDERRLHKVADAMELLNCSRKKIYQLAREGRLDMVKFDFQTRITDRSLRRLLDEIEGNQI